MYLFFLPFQAQNVLILFLKVLKFSMFSDGVNPLHMSWNYMYCRVSDLQGASTINMQLGLIIVLNGWGLQNMDHITVPKHCVCSGCYMFFQPSRCQNESKQPWGNLAKLQWECVIFLFFFLLKKNSASDCS